jgi:hypothetical protein
MFQNNASSTLCCKKYRLIVRKYSVFCYKIEFKSLPTSVPTWVLSRDLGYMARMKMDVFWYVALCSLVETERRLRGAYW